MTKQPKPKTKTERLFAGLAQRCNEWLRDGHNIVKKWVKDKSGRNVCKAHKRLPGKGC